MRERVPAISAQAPQSLLMVGDIIEGIRLGLHRPGGDSEHGPGPRVKRDLESIETAAHIEYLAGRDEMACAEFELLPAGAQCDTLVGVRRRGEIDEDLMRLKRVLIGKPRSAHTAGFDAALRLCEETDMLPDVRIGMQKIALEQETVG